MSWHQPTEPRTESAANDPSTVAMPFALLIWFADAAYKLGGAIAVAISWNQHQSILWAVVHGLLSWVYIGYFALTR